MSRETHGLIHPSAVVDPRASLGRDVSVGPFAVVGAGVSLGDRTQLAAHAVVLGPSVLGADNVVGSFAVVGGAPQLKKPDTEGSATLVMGDRNVVREHVTIHRGGQGTRVGDDNLFMVGSHVAHDAQVGSNVTLANGTQLAGHAVVEDHATFGGMSGVAQFVRVGESAFVAAGAMCERAVPPFVIVQGDRARVRALNVVGLRRRGVPAESIERLAAAFRQIFAGGEPVARALAKVSRDDPYVARLLAALEAPARGAPRGAGAA
jgi:UDP-N-acetylglucosamine acyltransferase